MRPQGVYAAVLVPRVSDGAINERGFRGILEFLPGKKISRIVVNGATGEYCLTTPRDLARLLATIENDLGELSTAISDHYLYHQAINILR